VGPLRRILVLAAVASLLGSAPAGARRPSGHTSPRSTHGVVVGDVTARTAVLWARASRDATLHVVLSGGRHRGVRPLPVRAGDDYTGQVALAGLSPATRYTYRVWFSARGAGRGPVARGSFRTAPSDRADVPVKLAFGGDVSGQNVCRDAAEGFPIMDTIRAERPDIFVGLGDMIYADNACAPLGMYGNAQVPGDFGPAADLAGFWAHWRYNRAEARLQRLLAGTNYVGVWDDHEVVNDFGPLTDTRSTPPYTPGVHLMPLGLRAFMDYTPLATPAGTTQLYRALRWGKNLEVFALDTRQYRDANFAPDSAEHPKTMLGREQLAWLEDGLASSDASWKVIVSSVPMSIPTGFPPTNGRDGWANYDQDTGFEHELLAILRFIQAHGIRNTVWITTDVHFAEAFRYTPFADDPGFVVYELATGPLNAGIFPIPVFDETLNPQRLAYFAPAASTDVTSWELAKRWFNFGSLEADADELTMQIVDTAGERRFALTIPRR
jgi:alkaline phosphatase D